MNIKNKIVLSSLAVIMLCLSMFIISAQPASASTTLTINVSGNIDQSILDNFVQRIIKAYNLDPDQILIRYPGGKTKTYTPDSPTVPVQPQPQPTQPEEQEQQDPGTDDSTPAFMTADEQEMLNLVNRERAKVGLSPLEANAELVELARKKAEDMIKKGYFSHTSPTYGSPFDMMKSAGISYRYAGENLAGAYSVDVAHENLMNSSGHRANILNTNFKEVGIGVVEGGPYGKMFVQMFIG